jgi:hypothetical protein
VELGLRFFFYRTLYRGTLIGSFSTSSSVLSKVFLLISSLFWCHMYDVLVYKMLWDWKKILNINLWRIIRLSMRLATGLCSHISLHSISLEKVYCTWKVDDLYIGQSIFMHAHTRRASFECRIIRLCLFVQKNGFGTAYLHRIWWLEKGITPFKSCYGLARLFDWSSWHNFLLLLFIQIIYLVHLLCY